MVFGPGRLPLKLPKLPIKVPSLSKLTKCLTSVQPLGSACDKINPLLLAQRCSFTTQRNKPKGYYSDTCERYRKLNLGLNKNGDIIKLPIGGTSGGGGGGGGGGLPGLPGLGRPAFGASSRHHVRQGTEPRQPQQRPRGHARVGDGAAMITRRTKIQLVIFALITMLGVSFVGARYAKLDRLIWDKSYTVDAHFSQSGGIFTGAEVSYRGVTVGRVSDIEADRQGRRRDDEHRQRLQGHPQEDQGRRREQVGRR